MGIISTNTLVETDCSGLVAGYVGQTVINNIYEQEQTAGRFLLLFFDGYFEDVLLNWD